MTHPFAVRDEITADATPDEVWEAIASGPGVNSWLMGRTEIDSASKTSTFNMFGEVSSSTSSTAWEPGHRYATLRQHGRHVHGLEWLIESRDGVGRRLPDAADGAGPARLSVPGIEPVNGTVEFVGSPSFVGMRTDDAMYMLIHGYNDMVFATAHYFDDRDPLNRDRGVAELARRPRGLINEQVAVTHVVAAGYPTLAARSW